MTLRLKTFGSVALMRDRTPLGGTHSQRRRLALLAYLAASEGTPVTRDKLIDILWPERDSDRGRHSLSQLLYALRSELDPEAIIAGADEVRLDPAVLPSDVAEFGRLIRNGDLEPAVELYRGPFLDGFHLDQAPGFERWADDERDHLRNHCARALERLAERSERAGSSFQAAEWWRRRVGLDPTDAQLVTRLMRALVALGDRTGALKQAASYETLVRTELEAAPDAAVVSLAGRIRRELTSPLPLEEAPAVEAAVPASLVPARKAEEAAAPAVSGGLRRRPRMPWRVGVGLAASLVAGFVWWQVSNARPSPVRPATVVVGEFDGPDTLVALAVREALRAELSNLDGVTLVSDPRVNELKVLMRIPTDSGLRGPRLLELGQRGGARAVITGSVRPLGRGATVAVQVLDPRTGDAIGTASDHPTEIGDLVTSVARLGRSLRGVLTGLAPDTSRALPSVTTASLPALSYYALARVASGQGARRRAIGLAELALQHDSAFVLAHYLAGDLLWFVDEQTHADSHLVRAVQLGGRLPGRERLLVRARYEQLTRDQADSALAYWELLRAVSPGEAMAYEGMAWTLRALGRYEEAAAAADTAMALEPTVLLPSLSNAIYAWQSVGDTARALALGARAAVAGLGRYLTEAQFYTAITRADFATAAALADSASTELARLNRLHQLAIASGQTAAARALLDTLTLAEKTGDGAALPRALLLQGWAEARPSVRRGSSGEYARRALQWVRSRDLSPAAVARLAERIADVAARSGDTATIAATRGIIDGRDQGRSLPSYTLARKTLVAASAYAAGEYPAAAELARQARIGVYFSRSLNTLVVLEADARLAAGEPDRAAELYHLVGGERIADGDYETWVVLRAVIRRELRSMKADAGSR